MSASEYTEQDRANEGCCWDYARQLCRGGGCLCDCHATTEQILLSSRASLRRQNGELEADNGRLLGENTRLTALLAERDAEIARAYWIGDESSPDGRIYCRGCGRSRATRLFRAHADVCWVGAALAARGGERITT